MNSKPTSKQISVEESNPDLKYNIHTLIGQGQYGKVYKASIKANPNIEYAIKVIPSHKMKKNPKLKQLLLNEVEILTSLKHKNIINFKQIFIWEKKIFMVYEYCEGGDLETRIPLSQRQITTIAKKIISACLYAAKSNIIHRDLKPANILFKNGKVKVADWGFSRFLKEQHVAESFIGSPAYMAPQILKGQQYTSKADVWSFGMMIYECITGQFPWNASNIKKLTQQIQNKPLKLPPQISPLLKKLLKNSLVLNPNERASFEKLSSFFEMKSQNPQDACENNEELSVDEVKKCSFYLQMARRMDSFMNEEARDICLQIIIDNLQQLQQKTQSSFANKSQLIPSSPKISLRQFSKVKSQGKLRKQSTGKSLQKLYKYKKPQTLLLLEKQIKIIKKLRASQNKYLPLVEDSKNKIKLLINAILDKIQPKKGHEESKSVEKKKLAEMNCFLDIIMYKQLPDQYKEKDFEEYVTDLEASNRSVLLKLLNHKILYINKKYCRL